MMILEIALALTLTDIAWLAGDWQLRSGDRCVEEQWTAPSSNLLVGMGRTVAAGRTTSFEFMRIEARADGIYYVAQPGGKPPVDFKLASDSAAELVFVNPGGNGRPPLRIVCQAPIACASRDWIPIPATPP